MRRSPPIQLGNSPEEIQGRGGPCEAIYVEPNNRPEVQLGRGDRGLRKVRQRFEEVRSGKRLSRSTCTFSSEKSAIFSGVFSSTESCKVHSSGEQRSTPLG